MKLSKIYSNISEKFKPVYFNEGFNVIIGKVKERKDKQKSSHNLGKTLFIHLIDFLLLKDLKKEHFLKKHFNEFQDFVFFLEIQLNSGKYLTIRRSVKEPSKILIKTHPERYLDLTSLTEDENNWDYCPGSLDKARITLNDLLDLKSISPFRYRAGVSYFLRTQNDFSDVFQLYKVTRSKHEHWKPYLANLFGFKYHLIKDKYEMDHEVEKQKDVIDTIKNESNTKNQTEEYDKIKGLIEINESELLGLREQIDKFNFYTKEIGLNKELVEEVEADIANCNKMLYTYNYELEKIKESLKNKIEFKIEKARKIFEEVNVFFPSQLVKSYKDLEEFNHQLYSEREKYLKESLVKLEIEIRETEKALAEKSRKRERILSVLESKDVFYKFKEYQNNLVEKEVTISNLKHTLESLDKIGQHEHQLNKIEIARKDLIEKIREEVNQGNTVYQEIRTTFNEISKTLMNKSALLYVETNKEGNLEFKDDIVNTSMDKTSQGKGFSHKKVLCEIFDLTILKTYHNKDFFRFVYQDGALESLDNRWKLKLITLARDYCQQFGLQYILTLIEDDLPRDENDKPIYFTNTEIIRELDDTGCHGRLFNMDEF